MKPFTLITSQPIHLLINNVDTDQIIPAQFLKVTDRVGLGQHLFSNWRKQPEFVLNQVPHQASEILLAGENFGCGSSREHAVWALQDYGFKVVLALSFGDIFYNNALKNGLLPIIVTTAVQQQVVNQQVTVNLAEQQLSWSGGTYQFTINPFQKYCLLNGVDDLGYLLNFNQQIIAYEQAHPCTAR